MSIEDIIYYRLKSFRDDTVDEYGKSIIKHNSLESAEDQSLDLLLAEVSAHIDDMEKTRENYAFRHLYSCRKWIGNLIVFCKKVIRKLLKWYIEPICFQQTAFNNAVTPSIGRLAESIAYLSRREINTYEQLQSLAEKSETKREEIEKNTHEALWKIREENATLQEHMNVLHNAIEELKAMLMVNQSCLSTLEKDIECVRGLDLSIFDDSQKSFFDKNTTSQSGEDSIMAYVLMMLGFLPENVTYLDLGANHARELSNTYYFYKQGASGVLVEANPDLIPELKLMRSRDVILNSYVSDHDDETVDFYILNGDGLCTADLSAVNNALSINKNLRVTKTEQVRTITIQSILNNYMKTPPTILNIDIEGEEMNVLAKYDFDNYRPIIICVEMIPYETNLVIDKKNGAITEFLNSKNYMEYAFTGVNSIFVDRAMLKGSESV